MSRTRRTKLADNLLQSTDRATASVAGGMQEVWRQSLLLRVSGSGGSARATLDRDPSPVILGDGTRISFASAEHH